MATDSTTSTSQSEPATEIVLEIDQELLLNALVESLQLLDALENQPQVVQQVRLRLAHVLLHSPIPSTRSYELRQLANHHSALARRVLSTLALVHNRHQEQMLRLLR